MDFEEKVPEWEAQGTEPPATLKVRGFEAGYKPPAAFFNWFWNGVSRCLTEIRAKLSGHADDKNNPHGVTAAQIGLDKVNNTPDTDKYVKYAQESGETRKLQNSMTVRLNGGRTEGTDQFTFDGSTGRTVNITPDKIGAAEKEHTHTPETIGAAASSHSHDVEDITGKLPISKGGTGSASALAARTALGITPANIGAAKTDLTNVSNAAFSSKATESGVGIPVASAETSDFANYTATIPGVTDFYTGLIITVIPVAESIFTENPMLDVNGSGSKPVAMLGSENSGDMYMPGTGFFSYGCPVTLRYLAEYEDGVWVVLGQNKPLGIPTFTFDSSTATLSITTK